MHKNMKGKLKMKHEQGKNGFRPFEVKHNSFNNFRKAISNEVVRNNERERWRKPGLVKCWKCGGNRYLNNCPEKKSRDARMYHVKDVTTVGDVSKSIPRIYAALDNRKVDHQPLIIESEG